MEAHIIGNLVLSMVEVVKLKKLANGTNQGFPFPAHFHPEPFYQHIAAYIHYISIDILHFQWLHRSPFLCISGSQYGSWASGISVNWEFVRNAKFLASTQAYKIKNSSVGSQLCLTSSLGDCDAH